MQLSVKAHLTIYGDVKESDLNKPSYIREKLGLGPAKPQLTANEADLIKYKSEIMRPPEPKAEIMKASG
jgi:hypothetical protein